jgi:hypothetical protein
VYLLRLILHDWNDADSAAILTNIRRAIGSARATLVIAEVQLTSHALPALHGWLPRHQDSCMHAAADCYALKVALHD